MAEVRYENATRIYPGAGRPAVDALTLAIRDGEFVVMAGPPGCGTTTALRMLAGLEEVDEGTILIGGQDMAGVPSRDRDVAIVFQNYALYPSKTVGENMGFALRMRGIGEEESARRVREAARLLDLEPLLDCPAASASGSRWAGPSSGSLRSSAWMSRCPTWTPACARRPRPRSPSFSAACR
jgi:multiple sugar transport system ATP-binding protein